MVHEADSGIQMGSAGSQARETGVRMPQSQNYRCGGSGAESHELQAGHLSFWLDPVLGGSEVTFAGKPGW